MSDGQLTIRRARLHGRADPAITRLRLGSLLAGAELRPSGLPPAAVLCVRRVADPLPGALRLDASEARPPPEWERAFVASLERALRGAARPAREAVPAGAEAVLFADRAELLACLARAAHDGTVWASWWWQEVRSAARSGSDPVVAAWLETPEHVPAALELLAARGEAARFVAGMSPADATALVERVATVFGVPQLRVRSPTAATATPAERGADAARAAPPPAPPWRHVVPETAERRLSPQAELLLGVALALRRSPGPARSPVFAAAAQAWLAATLDTRPANEPERRIEARPDRDVLQRDAGSPLVRTEVQHAPQAAETETAAQTIAQSIATDRTDEPEPLQARDDRPAPAAEPGSAPPVASQTSPRGTTVDAPGDDAVAAPSAEPPLPVPQQAQADARPASPPRPERKTRAARPRATTAPQQPSPAPEPVDDMPALVVETDLGGVFYLLNLALFLDLYGDFTRPLEPGLALSPWDLLALLAPKLLADPSRNVPIWPLLARLAGRKRRERPGSGFRAPAAWRTPPGWLEPFDHDGPWRWSAARDTLRIVHPAGFDAVAVPRRDEPAHAQLARELRRLRPLAPELRRATLPREPVRPLARWTSRLAGYADARLRRALDLDPGDALDAVLLRRRARIFVSPTHVDVFLRLADLPLSVRFAGLDRTPGWIPAAGRYVALHFE